MKILQVVNHFFPHKGGIEQVVFSLSKELIRRGHQVTVICANEPPAENTPIENIKVKRLPYLSKISNTNLTLSLGPEILKEDFDLMHTHLPYPWNATVSAFTALLKNKPLFLTYHNDITGRGLNKLIAGTYNLAALPLLLAKSEKIFITHKGYLASSPFLKRVAKKIVVAPPGIDLDKFKILSLPKKEENVIFFLSILDKLHRYKGLDYLLRAIKKIIPKIFCKLYIGGRGDLLEYYQEWVNKNGLNKAVSFLGFLSDDDLIKYYNLCDVFVLPSISAVQEGFGLVALEAMACGKPVIVTEVVGVAEEIKNNYSGMVVRSKDADELSLALEYLLSHKQEASQMGSNAHRAIQANYTWQKHADIVEAEYIKCLGAK
jgi:glycosyltransferase involved in cell wall biosynthesis